MLFFKVSDRFGELANLDIFRTEIAQGHGIFWSGQAGCAESLDRLLIPPLLFQAEAEFVVG